jgi:hypothetical protein
MVAPEKYPLITEEELNKICNLSSMEQSPSRGANSRSSVQEIPSLY